MNNRRARYKIVASSEKESAVDKGKADDSHRHMGLLSGISLIVGSVIGSGIFVSPREIMLSAGSLGLALLIWVAGGLICIPGAICYAELGCLIPSSGGDYTYIKEAFGDLFGFLRVWSEVIVTRPCILSVNALTTVQYILYPFMEDCISQVGIKLMACIGVLSITALNAFSLRGPVIFQNIGTVGKIFALGMIIVCGLVQLCKGRYSEFLNPFKGTERKPINIVVAIYAGLFPYTGWNYLNNAVEELKNPARNLPIAIFVSLIFCTVVYTLTFASYFTMLSAAEVKEVPATAVIFIERIYPPLRYVIPFFVGLSALGGLNGNLFSISRMFFVAGRDGLSPGITATKHMNFGTPLVPTLIEGLLGCLYICVGNVNKLLKYLSFTYWLVCLTAVLSLFFLRKRYTLPKGQKGVNAGKFSPIIFIFAILLLIVLSLAGSREDTKDFVIGLMIVLSGVPVYLIFVRLKKPEFILRQIKRSTIVMQKALNCYPEPVRTLD